MVSLGILQAVLRAELPIVYEYKLFDVLAVRGSVVISEHGQPFAFRRQSGS